MSAYTKQSSRTTRAVNTQTGESFNSRAIRVLSREVRFQEEVTLSELHRYGCLTTNY